MTKLPAVFFDRDDTLIVNIPYLGDPTKVRLMPGAREAVERLHQAGFLLFIASNQSGVGRGLITQEQVEAVNDEMFRQLGANRFCGVYNCYFSPDQPGGEDGRKPSPAMLLQAAAEHPVDLSRSFMLGDRESDVGAGHNAGCKSILVHPSGEIPPTQADLACRNLDEAVAWILKSS
jgi:D-glycero-D-manno-heptose 1,7-bisphosphate phosphatase